MGQVCNKNSKSGKPIRLPENDMPYINVEENVVNENGRLIEDFVVPKENNKFENEIQLFPAQTLPETIEPKINPISQLSNSSFASNTSLSGLEVDEGEDRSHPLKVFFDE